MRLRLGNCQFIQRLFINHHPLFGRRPFPLVQAQQNQHGYRGDKKHIGFPEGIERAIVQNHARDNVHRPRLLQPFFNVTGRNLIVHRILGIARFGQPRNGYQHNGNQGQTKNHRRNLIHSAKSQKLPVMHIINMLPEMLVIRKQFAKFRLFRLIFFLGLHLHPAKQGILFPVKPAGKRAIFLHVPDPPLPWHEFF